MKIESLFGGYVLSVREVDEDYFLSFPQKDTIDKEGIYLSCIIFTKSKVDLIENRISNLIDRIFEIQKIFYSKLRESGYRFIFKEEKKIIITDIISERYFLKNFSLLKQNGFAIININKDRIELRIRCKDLFIRSSSIKSSISFMVKLKLFEKVFTKLRYGN